MYSYFTYLAACFLVVSNIAAEESITGMLSGYRDICKKAISDNFYFQNFRSLPEYSIALELADGEEFAKHLNALPEVLGKIDDFQKLDSIGNPPLVHYPNLGNFSATTLRYITIAHQIQSLFDLPAHAKIVEIGAGFGGQCYVLSKFHAFSKYYIYDLPEVEALVAKVTTTLAVKNVVCVPAHMTLPEEKVDLLISNYAYSECPRRLQLEYFHKIIKKADHGYMIYNSISGKFNIDSLSANELVQMLKNHGKNPKISPELISTHPGNVLITW